MRSRAAVLIAAFLLSPGPAPAASVARDGQVVMGTVLEVTVIAQGEEAATSMAAAAIDEARRWDDALTIWRDEGELARLNAGAGQGPRPVSARLRRGLAEMRDLAAATGGAFEPAVASLAVSRRVLPVRGIGDVLELAGSRAALLSGSALDPGAIGKGLALDAMADLLRGRGAIAAFLDFGGSSQTAVGSPPGDAGGWTVVVAARARGEAHGTLKIRDESLSTSRSGAPDTTPVLDPRSGRAVPAGRLATVRAPRAAAADAWSTALVVRGRPGLGAAAAAGAEALVEDAGGLATTPGFRVSTGDGD